jgi:hypothetical protein
MSSPARRDALFSGNKATGVAANIHSAYVNDATNYTMFSPPFVFKMMFPVKHMDTFYINPYSSSTRLQCCEKNQFCADLTYFLYILRKCKSIVLSWPYFV